MSKTALEQKKRSVVFFIHVNISVVCCDAFWISVTRYQHTYWEELSVQTMLMDSLLHLKYETSTQHSFSVTVCVCVWCYICVCMSASIIWFPVTSQWNCCSLTLHTLLNMFISMQFMPGLCTIQNCIWEWVLKFNSSIWTEFELR